MKTLTQALNMKDLRERQKELKFRLSEVGNGIDHAVGLYNEIVTVEEYMRDTLANAGENASPEDMHAYREQQELKKKAEQEAKSKYGEKWDEVTSQPGERQK